MRKTLFFCCIALLLTALFLPVGAATVNVHDTAELLSAGEETTLQALLSASDGNGVSLHLYTMQSSDADDYPTNGTVLNVCGITRDTSSVILVVRQARGTYYYDMYLFGAADKMFSNADVDRILDDPDVYDNLKSGSIVEGAAAFFTLSLEAVSDYHAAEAARIARKPQTVAITGIVVALLTAGITALVVALAYRTKKHGDSYPLSHYATLRLTRNEDRFVGSHVTRVRIQSNSGGGGGGGGGRRGGR
jgi:uncharacterized membrane protein YgcG